MNNLFVRIYVFFKTKRSLLFVFFFLTLGIFGYFASRVELSESVLQMLPHDKNSAQMAAFLGNSKFSDRIVVAVSQKDTLSPPDPDQLVMLADTLVETLQANLGKYINSIQYVANDSDATELLEIIDAHLPIFLDSTDYSKIDSLLKPSAIQAQVENNYKILTGPGGIGMKRFIVKDPLGLNFIGYKKLNDFQVDEQFELYDGHYLTKNHQNLLIIINPANPSSETNINSDFFAGIDSVVSGLTVNNSKIQLTYFGAPVVAAGNAKQIRSDTKLTVTLTVILLLIIVILFFRNKRAPLLIITPVIFGGLFALSIIYILQGSISVIAVGAGSLILGIAVNYSMHFLTHYKYHPDITATIRELAFPMTVGSLTTIGGFLCLRFVNAPVLQDLGLFASLSLAGAALASLIFLPHFVPKHNVVDQSSTPSFIDKIADLAPSPKFLVLLIILLTPVFLYFAKDVEFESDMYKINYMSPELRLAEEHMNQVTSFHQKSIFVFTNGNNLQSALEENEKIMPALQELKKEGSIISFASVSSVLPTVKEQQRRIRKWNSYWNDNKRTVVFDSLKNAGLAFNFKESAFQPFLDKTAQTYSPLQPEAEQILKKVLLNNFIEESNGKTSLIGIIKTIPGKGDNVYKALERFKSSNAFDRKYITDRLLAIVNQDFNFITLWTSLLVFAALLLIYGRIELAVLTFIPMLVSWIWILGIMSLAGIKFNIVNIVLSTFIFALGDDFCIFTTDGLQQEYSRKIKIIKSLKVSIALSAITTVVGMGVLILARHPALSSIAFVSIIGILSVWFISQTLQPVLFRFLITNPTSQKHEPYTFFNILKSIFAFSFFILGSLLISGIGLVLLKLIPGKSPRVRLLYHHLLSKFAGSMINIMSNVNKKVINKSGEDFSKPAVIIVNHTSFLDILLLIMMHPKLILLTNKWVWNSPVFGLAVRLAEYYPVAEGAENTITQLSDKVAAGYSIVVFPEGTRSVDGTIGRFHKGAFFLAENLKVDLLPIVIHGAASTMTKGFFYLKNGKVTLNILPRISPTDDTFGITYQERSKKIRRYFMEELKKLEEKFATPNYYKDHLVSNFLYKGPILEWYLKVKLKLENNYKFFDNLLPRKGNILDIGCGYGFLPYMLHYTSSDRNILGIDYDEEKISIAQNGYDKRATLDFKYADALSYDFQNQDAIILSDVLHYLSESDQVNLLEKCVSRINNGGMIVIRDGIKDYGKRHWGTRLTELFSTRLLGFNKTGQQGLTYISSQLIESVAHRHQLGITVSDTSKLTSNIIFVLKKQG